MNRNQSTSSEQKPRPRTDSPAQTRIPASGNIDNNVDAMAGLDPATGNHNSDPPDPREPNLLEQFSKQLNQKQPVGRIAPVITTTRK